MIPPSPFIPSKLPFVDSGSTTLLTALSTDSSPITETAATTFEAQVPVLPLISTTVIAALFGLLRLRITTVQARQREVKEAEEALRLARARVLAGQQGSADDEARELEEAVGREYRSREIIPNLVRIPAPEPSTSSEESWSSTPSSFTESASRTPPGAVDTRVKDPKVLFVLAGVGLMLTAVLSIPVFIALQGLTVEDVI
mmetsp:Transcript_10178/g.20260  ORF Transcript_10178/g.20260 Transcript_10178/m.20260 type:complete len:200 (+) Transcript_10178:99-698(+)